MGSFQTILKPTRARGLDTSGNNNHAQIYSGRALEFDGVTDYLSVSEIDGTTNFDEGNAYSWATWINFSSFSNSTNWFLGKGSSHPNILLNSAGRLIIREAGGNAAYYYLSSGNFTANTWYRLVVTADTSNNLKTYINGVLDYTLSEGDSPYSSSGTFGVGGNNLGTEFTMTRIGGGYSSNAYPLNGMMSDFQIWDTTLTQDDVTYDYLNPEQLALNRGGTSLTNSNLKLWYPMNDGHRGNQSYILDASNTGLGDNMVTNGTFDTDTHWHKGSAGGISISDGKLRWDGTQTNWAAAQNNQDGASNTTVSGQTYRAKFDWTRSASTLQFKTGGAHLNIGSGTSGSADFTFIADGSYWYFTGNSDMIATVDNVEVYPINAKNNATTAFYGDEMVLGDDKDADTVGNWVGASGGSVTGGYDSGDTDYDAVFRIQASSTDHDRAELPQSDLREVCVAGRTYKVTFNYKFINTTDMANDAYITVGGTTKQNIDRTNTSWTEYDDTFIATDGTTNIRVYCQGQSGHADNEMLFDNFSIKEVGVASGWTDADQQLDIPQTALQSYNQLAYTTQITSSTQQLYAVDYAPNFGTDNFTVCFSLFTDANSSSNIRFMYMKTGSGRFILRQKYDETLEIYLDDGSNNTGWAAITSSNAMNLGEWTHYTVVVTRGSVDTVKTYINGEYEGTSLSISSITGNINAGGDFYPMGFDSSSLQMIGSINEIAIFKGVALSLDEIEELYNNGTPLDALTHSQSSNLNAYWRNNGLGSWADLTGTNNPIVPQSNCTETMLITEGVDSSRDSQGFLMNRQRLTNSLNLPLFGEDDPTVDDNASTNYADVETVINDDVFSVSCWFKPSHSGETQQLVCNRDSGDEGWVLMSDSSNNIEFKIGDGTDTVTVDTGANITVGTWVHIAVTYAGSAGAIKTYINGAATATGTATNVGNMSSISSTMRIGARSFTSPMNGVQGEVDDVLYYDDVLSATEVLRNYNAGKRSHR